MSSRFTSSQRAQLMERAVEFYDACGYTLEGTAELLGVSRSTISRWLDIMGVERRHAQFGPRQRRYVTKVTLLRWISLLGRGEEDKVFDELCRCANDDD